MGVNFHELTSALDGSFMPRQLYHWVKEPPVSTEQEAEWSWQPVCTPCRREK
jgi:hypothetical protein